MKYIIKKVLEKFWFINDWGEEDIGFSLAVFEIWFDFWAVDITVLNFTFGFRLNT